MDNIKIAAFSIYLALVLITYLLSKELNLFRTIIFSIIFLVIISLIYVGIMHFINRNEKYEGLIYFFHALEVNVYYIITCIFLLVINRFIKLKKWSLQIFYKAVPGCAKSPLRKVPAAQSLLAPRCAKFLTLSRFQYLLTSIPHNYCIFAFILALHYVK